MSNSLKSELVNNIVKKSFSSKDGLARLLLHERSHDKKSIYNWLLRQEIRGPLDVKRFKAAVKRAVVRHPIFYSSINIGSNKPINVTKPEKVFFNTSVMSNNNKSLVENILKSYVDTKFELTQSPLCRSIIFHTDKDCYTWVFIAPRFIFDSLSESILLNEISKLYNAPRTKLEKPNSFIDSLEKVSQIRKHGNKLLELDRKLNKAAKLEMPTDMSRLTEKKFQGARQLLSFSNATCSSLSMLAKSHHLSLKATLLAAFNSLLYRYTGQTDIVVGTIFSTRQFIKNSQFTVGFFENLLPVRAQFNSNDEFIKFVKGIDETLEEYKEASQIPFAEVIELLKPDYSKNRSPFFDTLFILQDESYTPVLRLNNLKVERNEQSWGTSRFDLVVELHQDNGLLTGFIEYDTSLYKEETIERLAEHYRTLVDDILMSANKPIKDLSILTTAEKKQFSEWNDTAKDFPNDQTIHHFFEIQAKKTPSAVALVCRKQQLTYKSLNLAAENLVNSFDNKLTKNCRIGLCAERSVEMVIAMLAILKAGCAIVPLEVGQNNQDARDYKLKETECKLVIVTQKTASLFSSDKKVTIVSCQYNELIKGNSNSSKKKYKSTPDDISLIPFTSGTTGKPKGILVHHRGIVNWSNFLKKYIQKSDRVFLSAPITFDASLWEMFCLALHQGGAIYLNSDQERIDVQALKKLFNEKKITVATFTPTFLSLLTPNEFPSLRVVFAIGEALKYELIVPWLKKGVKVFNGYGPTEVSPGTNLYECGIGKPVYIGKPIDNLKTYILDSDLRRVPVGVWGELCISGPGVTKGYLNRDELTKQKFCRLPGFESKDSKKLGELIYRTGDLARFLPDGNIEFRGRIKQSRQVKIFGVRLELDAVENALLSHNAVKQVAVKSFGETQSQNLVAFVVYHKNVSLLDQAELKFHLKNKLKLSINLPINFDVRSKLPLNNNGKLDYEKLVYNPQKLQHSYSFLGPKTDTEKEIHVIWCKILQLPMMSVDLPFSDIGGNSFQHTQMVNMINDGLLKKSNSKLDLSNTPEGGDLTIRKLSKVIASLSANKIIDIKLDYTGGGEIDDVGTITDDVDDDDLSPKKAMLPGKN